MTKVMGCFVSNVDCFNFSLTEAKTSSVSHKGKILTVLSIFPSLVSGTAGDASRGNLI